MAIAIDASSPALVTGNSVASLTTASFTPPNFTLLLAFSMWDTTGAVTPSVTMSNNGVALTWTFVAEMDQGTGATDGMASCYYALLQTGRAITVTATPAGTGFPADERGGLKVYAITGHEYNGAGPIGATGSGESTTNNLDAAAYTSTADNSWGFGCASEKSDAGAPTSTDDEAAFAIAFAVDGEAVAKAAATATSGTAVTLNFDAAGAGAAQWNWVACEILLKTSIDGILFVTSGGATIGTAASTWSFVPGPSSMTAGSAIIVGIGCASSAVTVSTITDNTTNLYLRAVARGTPKPAAGAELWYAQGFSTASTRVSLTLSGTSSGSVAYAGFTGFSTGTPLGPTNSSQNSTNSTAHSITQITSTSTGVVVISFNRTNVSTISPIRAGSSYTAWISTGVAVRTFGQYQINSGASTATSPWTNGAAGGSSGTCLFAGVHAMFYDTVVIAGAGGFYYGAGGFCLMGVQH